MKKCTCGSYAIYDDPNKELCDRCWRDRTIAEKDKVIKDKVALLYSYTGANQVLSQMLDEKKQTDCREG